MCRKEADLPSISTSSSSTLIHQQSNRTIGAPTPSHSYQSYRITMKLFVALSLLSSTSGFVRWEKSWCRPLWKSMGREYYVLQFVRHRRSSPVAVNSSGAGRLAPTSGELRYNSDIVCNWNDPSLRSLTVALVSYFALLSRVSLIFLVRVVVIYTQ